MLNPAIIARPGLPAEYARSERIAAALAARGIPAVAALDPGTGTVQRFGDATVLVYPWVAGRALADRAATPAQARRIGALLGQIHAAALIVPGLEPPSPEAFPREAWADLLARGESSELPWAADAAALRAQLDAWSARSEEADARLARTLVVSHRDLDQKNVLWRDDGTPVAIDWEAAGLVNPGRELAGLALDWSGHAAGPPDRAIFDAVLAGYRAVGAVPSVPGRDALAGVLGNWLAWLRFNMARSLGDTNADPAERALGQREAATTLAILRQLDANFPTWADWLDEMED